MRFIEWNCCGGFDRDLPALAELGCDLAVLCEVPEVGPPASRLDPAVDWRWVGDLPSKGLALASFGGHVTEVEDRDGRGVLSIAGTDPTGVGLLGIWACPPEGSNYAAQVSNSVTAYADWLRDTPSIVAGDFNLPAGGKRARSEILHNVFAPLAALSYTSVYHHFFAEEYGAETQGTYFHQRKQAAPFHIDFCFVHESLLPQVKAVELGTFDRWVAPQGDLAGHSDHVPFIVDLDI